jgi:hypothetical protein
MESRVRGIPLTLFLSLVILGVVCSAMWYHWDDAQRRDHRSDVLLQPHAPQMYQLMETQLAAVHPGHRTAGAAWYDGAVGPPWYGP